MLFQPRIIVDGKKLTRRQTRAVYREVHASARLANRMKVWAIVALLTVAVIPLGWLFGKVMFGSTGGPVIAILKGGLVGGAFGLTIAFVLNQGFAMIYRREIREAMSQFGYDLCGGCGYWLKGATEASDRCPECGGDVKPGSAA